MPSAIIVGGGPAGARCGERLARGGWQVVLFDTHLAWEKPCGGGLTARAVHAYPFLRGSTCPKKVIRTVELGLLGGEPVQFTLHEPILIYSRRDLNGLLLERARQAGCRLVRTAVRRVEPAATGVRAHTAVGSFEADFAVIATGARNRFVFDADPLTEDDLEQTLGYFIPVTDEVLKIRFLPSFRGYLWSFPRADHLSVGICGRLEKGSAAKLRGYLDQFVATEGFPRYDAAFYSHLLPSPRSETLSRRRVHGDRWALVGDAAALVDPITGEGLFYALRSADLLAESLLVGEIEEYPRRLYREFGAELECAARLAPRFFQGHFLRGGVTQRTVQFARRSRTFRGVLADLFAGKQSYRALPGRLWRQLPRTLLEIVGSGLFAAD